MPDLCRPWFEQRKGCATATQRAAPTGQALVSARMKKAFKHYCLKAF